MKNGDWGLGAGGWRLLASLLMTVASGTGLAKQAAANDATANLTIAVHIYDYAQVESKGMARAQDEASRVLERVGIKAAWLNCSVPGVGPQNTQACPSVDGSVPALVLRILPQAMAERAARDKGSLGFAQLADDGAPGFVGSVFYHRVESLAVDLACPRAVILGYALAHEIGHLLLGTNSHSPNGIMCAHWTEKELLSASAGRFGFFPQQAAKMRAEVRARAAEQDQISRLTEAK